ncbi:hypothetical protein D3C84_889510 [compost metagenome]
MAGSIRPWRCSVTTRRIVRSTTSPRVSPATAGTARPPRGKFAARGSKRKSVAKCSAACNCSPATPTTPPSTSKIRSTKAGSSASGRPSTCCGSGATISSAATGVVSAPGWASPPKATPWVTNAHTRYPATPYGMLAWAINSPRRSAWH